MKPWIAGAVAAAATLYLFPTDLPLSARWTPPTTAANKTDAVTHAWSFAASDTASVSVDSLPTPPDPFGLPASETPVRTAPTAGSTPPPRPWTATGRVGQRAALLTSADGRILVVSDGARVDSAVVVSIGSEGVTLEDRGGRFVLRLP